MIDVKYCDDPKLVQLIPGAAEGLRAFREAGYLIVVVTNQSGIGRGYFNIETLDRVNDRLRDELRRGGADYDALYYCPHVPADGCECRKPKPGLILRAASELGIDLKSSYSIGDRDLDIQAGKAAGTRTVLVSTGESAPLRHSASADQAVRSLEEAAMLILAGAKDQRNSHADFSTHQR